MENQNNPDLDIPIIVPRDIEVNDNEPPTTSIEMSQVGDKFNYGEMQVTYLITITNLMDDHKMQIVARILEHMLKCEVSKDEVTWWLKKQSRSYTYYKQFCPLTVKKTQGR